MSRVNLENKLPKGPYDPASFARIFREIETKLNQMLAFDLQFRRSDVVNCEIFESHSGNAVTYTLKGKAGVDLSPSNPGYLLFQSATLTVGDFDIVTLTANISVTVSSGSTLGHASNIPQHTFVYALKTGSTAELFVSNLPPNYPGTFLGQRVISTTAEGGAGASDSATGIYSTTARSNVQWVPLAKVKGTQTTAGTWAATPTQIDMVPFTIPLCAFGLRKNGAQSINNNTVTKVTGWTEQYDQDGVFDSATNNRHQPNVAGLYRYFANNGFTAGAGNQGQSNLLKNGSEELNSNFGINAAYGQGGIVAGEFAMNGTSDFVEFHVFQASGGAAATFDTTRCVFQGSRVAP